MTHSSAGTSASVRREYERSAGSYDRRWARYVDRSLALLRPHLAGRARGDVLDIGCGTGALLPRLAAWNARVDRFVGLDPAPAMLREAAATARSISGAGSAARVGFAAGEAEALPFAPASFDVAVSASALHYFPDPARALVEARRVLRPSGCFLLLDWSRDFVSMKALDLWMRATRVPYARMWSQREMRDLLHGAGFRVETERGEKIDRKWGLMLFEAVPA
jgi:ubiquinone/menaquinone biosynthesis C-methylase UbiE